MRQRFTLDAPSLREHCPGTPKEDIRRISFLYHHMGGSFETARP